MISELILVLTVMVEQGSSTTTVSSDSPSSSTPFLSRVSLLASSFMSRALSATGTPHSNGGSNSISASHRTLRLDSGSSSTRDINLHRASFRQNSGVGGMFDDLASTHDIVPHRVIPSDNDSPLRRAGLLQPKSYNPSYSSNANVIVPHSQDTIRLSTMQLSNMILRSPSNRDPRLSSSFRSVDHERDSFIVPDPHTPQERATTPTDDILLPTLSASLPPPSPRSSITGTNTDLSVSTTSFLSTITNSTNTDEGTTTPRGPPPRHQSSFQPSGLSLLLAHRKSTPDRQAYEGSAGEIVEEYEYEPTPGATTAAPATPTILPPSPPSPLLLPQTQKSSSGSSETEPLLTNTLPIRRYSSYSQSNIRPLVPPSPPPLKGGIIQRLKQATDPKNFHIQDVVKTTVSSLPAVLLGSLLNILDGISYGMLIFPAAGVFSNLGPMGVSMFFVSTVIAQLVYTFGGSGFAGANGSMMIEVVPFFHILATSIAREIGEENPREIVATTLVAYALSSVLTGLSFFLLGALKLGVIIGFFPRHILVGCIGGVGAFLIETGLTVSMRISDDDFTITWDTFKFMFLDSHNLTLWLVPLGLAVLLRVITHKYHHQLVFPLYFLVIPIVFYITVAAAQLNLGELRTEGWLFDMGSGDQESWYKFYSYFDFGAVRFGPLWSTLPTQFALLFFNILHPPLNVPALAVSLNEDVDTNKELVAHGYSNLLAGVFGTVPNYLVYVNTLLFYRVGGGTRIAGFLLAVATALLLFIGTGPIAFIPVMVVGALIFVLGIDLVKEALWDTRHRVSKTEYITIISIMVCMTAWDFVIGVLFGIIVSCFFFVVQNSQRRSIRAFHTGETAMSTVRRPGSQRAYIREVSKQTTILRLQGFLFFGTITHVEETIRNTIDGPSWQKNPVRFLVLDLSLVAGVDMSSAEAFVRIQRLLSSKYVTLVFCGFSAESPVGRALYSVAVLGTDGVELFSTFNDAMEWTENAYLRAWFRSQKSETTAFVLPGRQDADIVYQQSLVGSPRRSHLHDVGNRTIANEIRPQLESGDTAEPYNTLVKAFSSYGDITFEQFQPMVSYLERMSVPEGYVLWKQGDQSDGLYIIESGVLRATYVFADYTESIEESMVPGTLAGELSALSDLPRNATTVVERPAVLWKLSIPDLRRLEAKEPSLARIFMQLVLKAAKIDYDILLSALATRQ